MEEKILLLPPLCAYRRSDCGSCADCFNLRVCGTAISGSPDRPKNCVVLPRRVNDHEEELEKNLPLLRPRRPHAANAPSRRFQDLRCTAWEQ
ncbi:hypothetical protein ZHAS_00013536 [Anopheles sinensis]|uniref:Uncharacterized protein n=1 Tax=Anopheles sinensis TaxID=74873 RepID=A0A084W633_ANOSI|nr:hypothetical protein ZHAS_00013536 [Anopheles sinensis]